MKDNLVECLVCNCIEPGRDKVLIIYDETTEDLIGLFHTALLKHRKTVKRSSLM